MKPGTVAVASSPLVGRLTMTTLAGALAERGAPTTVPSAPPLLEPWLGELAGATAHAERPLVLLGFSAAGPRLFAAAQRTGADALVFLDARLPADGLSSVDGNTGFAELLEEQARPGGLVAPWAQWWGDELLAELIPDDGMRRRFAQECPPLPRAMFDEPLPAPAYGGPCGYLLLSETYEGDADEARRRGWPVRRLDGHHLWPLVEPDRVADAVAEVLTEL